jgi:hypothetical protein
VSFSFQISSAALQTSSASPSSRATGFAPVHDAISPEVRTFGALYIVFWTALLALVFVTQRKQRALRAEVDRLEAALSLAPGRDD